MKIKTTLITAGTLVMSALPLFAAEFNAGPIWNNDHAKSVCPNVCSKNNSTWDGNWRTTVQGQMSVCMCTQNNQGTNTVSTTPTNNEALITTIQQGIGNPDQLCKKLQSSASKDQLDWIQKWIAPMDSPKEEADKKLFGVFTSYPTQTDRLYNCLFKKEGLGGAL